MLGKMGHERELPEGIALQLAFPTMGESVVVSERIHLGLEAPEILIEIVRVFPQIESISYIVYDIWDISGYGFGPAERQWLARDQVSLENLRLLSQQKMALGICSSVRLESGDIAHIPMMDFCCDPSDDHLAKIVSLLTPFRPGSILCSGQSFHFWGFYLLGEQKWQEFLDFADRHRRDHGNQGYIFDQYFIGDSRLRGYSALRISAYPPIKPVAPYITEILHHRG